MPPRTALAKILAAQVEEWMTPSEVGRELDIGAPAVRACPHLTPERTSSGRRLYRRSAVEAEKARRTSNALDYAAKLQLSRALSKREMTQRAMKDPK